MVRNVVMVWLAAATACGGAGGATPVAPVAANRVTTIAPARHAVPDLPTPPAGYLEMEAETVVELGPDGAALLLGAEAVPDKVVPIFIGGTEAASIDMRMRGATPPRPLTHDLLDSTLRALHASLVKVQVDELRNNVFRGSVFIRAQDRVVRLDARPSDAIALAIGDRVPIYVARDVIDAAAVDRASVPVGSGI